MGKSHPVRYLIFICEKIGKINPPVVSFSHASFTVFFSAGISLRLVSLCNFSFCRMFLRRFSLCRFCFCRILSPQIPSPQKSPSAECSSVVSAFAGLLCVSSADSFFTNLSRASFSLHHARQRACLSARASFRCLRRSSRSCLLLRSRLFLSGNFACFFLLLRERPFLQTHFL